MKILHTSDWHLGKTVYGRSWIMEQKHFIDNTLLPYIIEERPDVVIIAGDVFDKSIASIDAIHLFDKFIQDMDALQVPLVVVTGNHDSKDRIAIGANVLSKENIHIVSDFRFAENPIRFCSGKTKLAVYPLPFMENVDDYETKIRSISEKIDRNVFNILVTHGFVTRSGKNNTEFVSSVDCVKSELFKAFDYVALGHIHSYKKVESNVVYSGSPFQFFFDESSEKKLFIELCVKDRLYCINTVEHSPLHNFRVIEGNFKQIINVAKREPSDDYMLICLKDSEPIYMPLVQLRVYYPNILNLTNDLLLTESLDISEDFGEKINDEKIIMDFFREICLWNPEDDDLDVVREQLKKISDL